MDVTAFREATLEDYSAVMAINDNVYGGLDYLPGFYKRFMSRPHMRAFLAQKNGEVVAFGIAQMVDNDTVMVLRAARFKVTYQGQGILRELREYMKRQMKRMHPTLHKIRIVVKEVNGEEQQVPSGFKEIFRTRARGFHQLTSCLKAKLAEMVEDATVCSVQRIDSEELQQLLQSELAAAFFPKGTATVNWVSYSMVPNNGPIILSESDVFISYMEGNKERDVTKVPIGLSAVTYIFCDNIGLRVSIDFYLADQSNVAVIKAHILYILRNAVSKAEELGTSHMHIEFYVDVNFPMKYLTEMSMQLELKPSTFSVFMSDVEMFCNVVTLDAIM